jgi:hypothetical protein
MRDHRIALFKAREEDVLAEMEEKDVRLEELEVSCLERSPGRADETGSTRYSQHFSRTSTSLG